MEPAMSGLLTYYKSDYQKVEVRIVTGEPYPGKDSEGDVVYTNTHWPTFEAARECVRRNIEAEVQMTARDVIEAERMLVQRRAEAADTLKKAAKLLDLKEVTKP
jgi:hypothetical protein